MQPSRHVRRSVASEPVATSVENEDVHIIVGRVHVIEKILDWGAFITQFARISSLRVDWQKVVDASGVLRCVASIENERNGVWTCVA